MKSQDRREFLKRSGMAAGAVVLGSVNLACATGAPRKQVDVTGSVIRFETAIEELASPGGAVALESVFLEYPILLVRQSDGTFVAVSSRCTHKGCTVEKEDRLLRCPCHNSAYDFEGRVLSGPAERSLYRYPVVPNGSIVEIHIEQ